MNKTAIYPVKVHVPTGVLYNDIVERGSNPADPKLFRGLKLSESISFYDDEVDWGSKS